MRLKKSSLKETFNSEPNIVALYVVLARRYMDYRQSPRHVRILVLQYRREARR